MESRFLQTSYISIPQTSASTTTLARIMSKSNLQQSSLPTFLRIKPREVKSFLQKRKMNDSRCTTFEGETVSQVEPAKGTVSQATVQIRGRTITRHEISLLKNGGNLSRNIVDTFLSMFKSMNSEILRKNECHDRIMIANADFSDGIFNNKGKRIRSKTNVLKYDYLVFPIENKHWALIVVNSREKKVKYLDPCRGTSDLKYKFNALFSFLRNEIMYHEKRKIEDTPWRDLQFERSRQEILADADSGIYILKQVEFLCLGKANTFNEDCVPKYRSEFLQLLF